MKYIAILIAIVCSTALSAQYEIGDKVADFSLKGVDGKMHSIQNDGGEKGSVIVFTCNHCPYAVLYEDRIIALQKKYKALGVNVIAINPNDPSIQVDDSYPNMIKRAQEKGFNFPYVFDEGQKVYPIFGATRTPQVFLIDKDWVLRYSGAIDDSPRDEGSVEFTCLSSAIDKMIAGDPIESTITKAVGCSIKTK